MPAAALLTGVVRQEIEDLKCGDSEPSPTAARRANEMVQGCQLSDVGTQPSINTPGAMGDVPAVGDAANAQIRPVKKIWEEFEADRSRIEDLNEWQSGQSCHRMTVIVVLFGVFIPPYGPICCTYHWPGSAPKGLKGPVGFGHTCMAQTVPPKAVAW